MHIAPNRHRLRRFFTSSSLYVPIPVYITHIRTDTSISTYTGAILRICIRTSYVLMRPRARMMIDAFAGVWPSKSHVWAKSHTIVKAPLTLAVRGLKRRRRIDPPSPSRAARPRRATPGRRLCCRPNNSSKPPENTTANMALDFAATYKVLVLGDSNVGKTCIVHRYCDERYYDTYISTIGEISSASTI